MAGAEDRATQGCDLSADPGAQIGRERARLAPPVQTNLGTKAINPKPPNTDPSSLLLLPHTPSASGTLISHASFIKLLTEPEMFPLDGCVRCLATLRAAGDFLDDLLH